MVKLKNSLVIAFDIDEVLAPTLDTFIQFHNSKYGTSLQSADFHSYDLRSVIGCSRNQMNNRYYQFMMSKEAREMLPIPGSLELVQGLSQSGSQLVSITRRPGSVIDTTLDWLRNRYDGLISPTYFANRRERGYKSLSKGIISREHGVQLIVEDQMENALECLSEGIPTLLLDKAWNQASTDPLGVTRVRSYSEIYDRVIQGDYSLPL
jgi:uncharacterized HAD superfamily protein